jgi:hypothetical protein
MHLKGRCHEIFDFWFFHESVSPKPLSIPLGPFRIFSKIRGDIHSSRCTTGVVDTGGKWKKSSIIKVSIILFGHLWEVELTVDTFCFQVHFKVSAARYCSNYLPPVSLTRLGGNLFIKKTRSKKSRDTVPLKKTRKPLGLACVIMH